MVDTRRCFSSLLVLLLADRLPSGSAAAVKRVVHVPGWPKIPLFSTAVVLGDLVYASGMVGYDFTTTPPSKCTGGISNETDCALRNVATVMRAAGTSMPNVVDCTVMLSTMDDFHAMNMVYMKWFPRDPPARAAFAVELAGDAAVEVKCIGSL